MVHRMAGRLDEKDIAATNVFEDLDIDLTIGKLGELGLSYRNAEESADLLRQRLMRRSGKDLELRVRRARWLALLALRVRVRIHLAFSGDDRSDFRRTYVVRLH